MNSKAITALRVVVVAAVAVPAVFFAAAASLAWQQAFSDARARVEQTARTVSEHASKVFDANRLLLQSVSVSLGPHDAQHWRAREQELHALLKNTSRGLPQIRGLWYWDEHGRPVAGSRMYPAPAELDVTDRDYFIALRERGGPELYVSRPIVTRETGATVFVVAQRRELPDGRFAGVLMAALTPDYFISFYNELERAEPLLTMAVTRQDGSILARLSRTGQAESLNENGPMLRGIALGQSAQTYLDDNVIEGRAHLVSYRQVDAYPLYVRVGLDQDAILSGWWSQVRLLAAFTFPLSAALAYVAWVALQRTRNEQQAAAERAQEAEGRRRAEAALLENRRLEALGRLTGGVAHDFNNLLAVVSNNVHLARRLLPGAEGSPQLASIGKAVETGARLTRQLLAFSRRQALRPEVLLLQDELAALAEVLRTAVGSRVQIRLELDASTPPVEADRAELELAVINLAINARDAMPEGGELGVSVRPLGAKEGGADSAPRVRLGVRDTGTGIAPELIEKVCEPFFTTKEPGKGTGLGLSQVQGFAAQAGGELRIDSELGRFTEVVLLLPASRQAPAPAATGPDALDAQPLLARVLLVEDHAEVGSATQQVLHAAGCSVVHLTTGDEARRYLQDEAAPVDVVVSDIVMPGQTSGVQLAQWLAERRPGLPVVLATGYSSELAHARTLGRPVLQKPVAPDILLQTLREVLASPG